MAGLAKALCVIASIGSLLSHPVSALPPPITESYDDFLDVNGSHPFAKYGLGNHQKRAGDYELRILSFGASIMSGTGSSTGDGSRRPLRDALRLDGWDVNMVGSKCTGKMRDCANIMLINLGTNDGNQNIAISEIGSRMENILNDVWAADGMSKTCVLLSTLLPTTNKNGAANRPTINSQYRALVDKKAGEGKCIYMADMQPNGQDWLDLETDFLKDETPKVHPNVSQAPRVKTYSSADQEQDKGHEMMAAIWYKWINKAISDGKIVEPGDFDAGDAYCDKFEGSGQDAGGRTQRGSGYEDGKYSHNSEGMGIILTRDSEWDRDQWKFARLFSPQYDDIVLWVDNDDESEIVFAALKNSGDGKGVFTSIDDMHGAMYCDSGKGVFFIDMNADGLDDFVCIDSKGNAYLSVNKGDGSRSGNKPPSFKYMGKIKDTETNDRKRVVLADIDGDGRGDYGVIVDSSTVRFWRNGWVEDAPKYWQSLGVIWSSTFGDVEAIRFEDVNGDGRDDFLWVSNDRGAVQTWTNSRSCRKGIEGNGLNVAWRQGNLRGQAGLTHLGVKDLADGDTSLRKRIHFARIYGTKTAFGNMYRQDYVYLKHSKVDGKHRFQMHAWKNTGTGGTKIKVDGNKYCNMMGHEDGSVDYVWNYQGGVMEMWASRGKKLITNNDPDGWWDYQGTIFTPPKEIHRKDLHLADWDDDGDCDIIWNDPDNNNAVRVWLNNFPKTGKWDWTYLSNPAPGVSCSERRGIGPNDLAVRFADITGNNRADYLCIKPDGHVSAFLHQDDGSWKDAGQVKFAEGHDRANLRWADVDGDGREDLLWIEKFSGDTFVAYNGGPGDPEAGGGSSWYWRKQDKIAYHGLAAGSCLFYADLDGNGRADEHYVLESFNNIAETSLSPDCGNPDVTGDDSNMANNLPEVPATDDSYCTAGTGDGDLEDLCEYVCQYNFCKSPCTCTSTGPIKTAPEPSAPGGSSANGDPAVDSLCQWACARSFCPSKACKSSEDVEETCEADPQKAESWEASGAASLLDNYIQAYGNDDWLRGMDVLYNLGSGQSNLNCDDVSSNSCVAPQGSCASWQSPAFLVWYAHEKLQDESIRNLGLVDQMIIDFKMDPPDTDALKAVFATISGLAGLSSLVTKRGSQGAADIFTLIGGLFATINAQTSSDADDLDKFAAKAKVYVGDILKDSNKQLESTLPAFFGNGDLERIRVLYSKLVDSGIVKPSTRISDVSRVLDGGGMIVPVTESAIANAFESGIKDTIAGILGGMLASLHYMVVQPASGSVEVCNMRKACAKVGDSYLYLVRRKKNVKKSETTPDKAITALEETYGINLAEMLGNVKACNNRQISDDDRTTIYIGGNRYPDCYFTLAFVSSGGFDYPISAISNPEGIPSWVTSGDDIWNDPREDFCKLEANSGLAICDR
ncbi:hypothetical protein FDECE_11769 [Fusarium decemcellulare]|nr:hypothetical protein FDECE_11769 [Fusarium decemcellulare]